VILVISYPGEEHTNVVLKHLQQAGREVVQVDLADFPSQRGLEFSWSMDRSPSYIIDDPSGQIDLRKARVAWWRRVRPFSIDQSISSPAMRAFAESETSQAINGMLDAIPCAWVNPRAADEAAHHKPYQWAIAHQLGLRLPRTLVTNKPEVARQFIDEVGVGKTVFKPFIASIESWRETRIIEHDDLSRLELVRYAPVIFQEYIEGVDLRITVIGDSVFAAEIDARNTSYPMDMRMVIGESVMKITQLPDKIVKSVLDLQRCLGLSYGAIDMRRTSQGEYVFFEVNPAGQWLFVEERTGLPISQAVADFLVKLDDIHLVEGNT
jgi:glutathione synthase/RimK-type ligase-like ATP-grasp enzyme